MVIGVISLTGIVVNDAIVMISTMNELRDKGASVQDAAARGAACVVASLFAMLTTPDVDGISSNSTLIHCSNDGLGDFATVGDGARINLGSRAPLK